MDPQTQEPSATQALGLFLEGRLAELHTAMPGRVVKWDAPKADIQPLLQRKYVVDGEASLVDLPVITNVPVMMPRAGDMFISLPVAVGDIVLLVFSERSLDQWLISQGGKTVDPADARKHHLSDAIAIPGLSTFAEPLTGAHAANIVIGKQDGGQMHVTPAGSFLFGSASAAKALALAETVDARLSALETAVTLPHMTPGGFGGPSVPPPFVPGAGGTSTASSKVKADA